MARTYKVLGQSNPGSGTDTVVYTVPSSTQTVISTVSVCNIGSTGTTYRIAVVPNTETLSNKHYIVFNGTVPASDSVVLTLGLTLDSNDKFSVYANSASVSFGLFGSEIS
jgi:hypothetical protein